LIDLLVVLVLIACLQYSQSRHRHHYRLRFRLLMKLSKSLPLVRGGLTAGTPITAAQFKLGTAAGDTSDRFIYDKSTGTLFFDSDGIGGRDKCSLQPHLLTLP